MSHIPTLGIDVLSAAFTRHYLPLRALAEARGIDPAKYERGLGCMNMAVPHPAEDTITLAAEAGMNALADGGLDPREVGLLIVGTETAVDHAKPAASYVQGLLGIPAACRVYEIKHACYGATAGVLTAAQWIGSGAAQGKKALVIAADIARYGVGSAGEPTQGAGAAAMVVSANPRLVEIDYRRTGAWSRDVHDFWRPLASPDARVDGALSLACYIEALENAFAGYAGGESPGSVEREFGALLFHVPFVKMTEKGHRALLATVRGIISEADVGASFAARVEPSLRVAREVGNAYTASLWLALASALAHGYPADTRVGFYSYGSGFCGEFFGGRIVASGAEAVPSLRALDRRVAIDVPTYESWMAERLGAEVRGPVVGEAGPFAYVGDDGGRRRYERKQDVLTTPSFL